MMYTTCLPLYVAISIGSELESQMPPGLPYDKLAYAVLGILKNEDKGCAHPESWIGVARMFLNGTTGSLHNTEKLWAALSCGWQRPIIAGAITALSPNLLPEILSIAREKYDDKRLRRHSMEDLAKKVPYWPLPPLVKYAVYQERETNRVEGTNKPVMRREETRTLRSDEKTLGEAPSNDRNTTQSLFRQSIIHNKTNSVTSIVIDPKSVENIEEYLANLPRSIQERVCDEIMKRVIPYG